MKKTEISNDQLRSGISKRRNVRIAKGLKVSSDPVHDEKRIMKKYHASLGLFQGKSSKRGKDKW